MVSELQVIVSRNVAKLVGPRLNDVDLDADLSGHYGLTSLSIMLLITSVCEESEAELTSITEEDLSRLRTSRDLIALLRSVESRDG
jgi:acyl carrier protein